MDYLELARSRLALVREISEKSTLSPSVAAEADDTLHADTLGEISEKCEKSSDALTVAAGEYDRIGEEIDTLFDQAQAARARGDMAEGDRLGAEVRALVVGPYLQARERYAALLNDSPRERNYS